MARINFLLTVQAEVVHREAAEMNMREFTSSVQEFFKTLDERGIITALQLEMATGNAVPKEKPHTDLPDRQSGLGLVPHTLDVLQDLREVHKEQTDEQADPYMIGAYNGIEQVLAIIENRKPEYKHINGDPFTRGAD